ncbi:hypothetical protein DMH04_08245 [Kibdelosporangium aridum]|uniref:Uncharacterized protein n=1 Tax=Kibdelosporangium aridum TaxID=2030 RepID=A0A428ZKL7_KIBAR|nr:hypothetical protein [Kibdelosporangium aridum]RSM88613.1 hypothetical protein DMH04_08245 [Kibdelosporangium aridum]
MGDQTQHDAARIELQELLLTAEDVNEFPRKLALVAADGMGSGISCGITLHRDGRPATVASSDTRATQVMRSSTATWRGRA